MEKQLKSLERRIAKLEKASALHEAHRQSWIGLNKKLKLLNLELKRAEKKAGQLPAATGSRAST